MRRHLLLLLLTALVPSAPAAASPGGSVARWSGVPPNVVVIMTDDLDLDGVSYMPRVQALLAEQGVTFTNSFVDAPVCCPSRASTLRGQYAHNTQVRTSVEPQGGFTKFLRTGDDTSTVATWLHGAGYRTALIGKYLSGYGPEDSAYVAPGWDEWYAWLSGHYFGYTLSANGTVMRHGNASTDYETDVIQAYATDFIRRTAGVSPFLLYVAPFAPHAPATPAPRHANDFLDARAPESPSFNESDVSDKPAYVSALASFDSTGIAGIDSTYRARLQTLQAVDEMVDSLVTALTQTGALSNTYVFFTSDNGFHLGEHRLPRGKTTAYEEDIRVPLIVRGPGVPAAGAREHLVSNIDLAPTIAALAGVSAPSFVDGLSLVALLGADPPGLEDWRSGLLVEYWFDSLAVSEDDGRFQAPSYAAVRTMDHTYVLYNTFEEELYDLHADPFQLDNEVSTCERSLADSLHDLLQSLRLCSMQACTVVSVGDGSASGDQSAWIAPGVTRAGRLVVTLRLPEAADVEVRLIDVAGRVRRAATGIRAHAGENSLPLDAHDLPAGVYLAQVRAGGALVARARVCVLR